MVRNTNPSSKFKELILFICHRSLPDRKFGATKLNKLLFFSDFAAYVKLGRPITGQTYQKLPHGPAPRAIRPVIDEMTQAGDLAQSKHDYHGKPLVRSVALRDADLSGFSAEEIAIVTEMIEEYWDQNATEISLISHEFDGWKLAKEGETIPYQVALAVPVEERESDTVIGPELAEKLRELRESA